MPKCLDHFSGRDKEAAVVDVFLPALSERVGVRPPVG